MTTYAIWMAVPNAGGNNVGYAAPCPTGLSLDSTVTGTGTNKSLMDQITGSTDAIKVGKLLHGYFQKTNRSGIAFMATADGGATFIKPIE